MKNSYAALMVFLLAACIQVDDIGVYWDKGTVDKALAGKWREDTQKEAEIRKVTLGANAYDIAALDEKSKGEPGYKPFHARTLTVGSYTFFITEPVPGDGKATALRGSNLWRYTLSGDILTLYTLLPSGMRAFMEKLDKKYSGAPKARIYVSGFHEGKVDKRSITIATFDETAFKVLSMVPDDKTDWAVSKTYRMQKP